MNSEQIETKPRRRWLRFSLRTMLVFMLVAGVFLSSWVASARRQRITADTIRATGAGVAYDVDEAHNVGRLQLAKQWIRYAGHTLFGSDVFDLLGYDLWCTVSGVDYSASNGDADAILLNCHDLPELRMLCLPFSDASDAGISHLRGHQSLEDLQLNGCTKITDACIPVISDIRTLQSLDLSMTQITSASVSEFVKLKNLCYLDLQYTKVTLKDIDALEKALPGTQIVHSAGRNW